MRISELAREAGVSVPTAKFYLREGLLQGGRRTAVNQATYDESHVRRLRLIRALREVGGLDLRTISAIVAAIDDPRLSRHQVFGVVQHALGRITGKRATQEVGATRPEVDRFVDGLGWRVTADSPARDDLAEALAALRRLGRTDGVEVFTPYAAAAREMAAWEVASIPQDEPLARSVERLVVGTIIYEAAFAALRRLAHEDRSATVAT